jgi:hypothetical protein
MTDPTQCSECRSILNELRIAGMSPPSRGMHEGVRKMMAGSDEGVDELLAQFPFRPEKTESLKPPIYAQPGFANLFRKVLDHKTRTGHNSISLFRR